MGVKVIYLISFLLLGQYFFKQNHQFTRNSFKVPNKTLSKKWNQGESKLYAALQTGNKKGLSRRIKNNFRELGILHLLTPSGIHLASLLLFFKPFLKKRVITFLIILIALLALYFETFYSIRRICYFYLLNSFLKNIRHSFIFTFIIDLCLGGYLSSPLSFIFSFLFWGTIIFSKKNVLELSQNLFFAQILSSYFFNNPLSYFSIFINPILTYIFSLVFPLLSLFYWSSWGVLQDNFSYYFIQLLIKVSDNLSPANSLFYSSGVSIFLLSCFKKRLSFIIPALLIYPHELNLQHKSNKNIKLYFNKQNMVRPSNL